MRSSRPLNDKDPVERNELVTALLWILYAGSLVVGLAAVVASLFNLAVQPVTGALLLICAVALLLYAADGFCRQSGVFRSMQSRK